jgi:DnaJ-class molecular chaperone
LRETTTFANRSRHGQGKTVLDNGNSRGGRSNTGYGVVMSETYTGMAGYTMQGDCFDMLSQQNPIKGGCLFNSDLSVSEKLKAGVPHQSVTSKSDAHNTNPLLVKNGAPAEPKEETMNREVFNIDCPNCSGDGRIGKKDGEVVRDCPRCEGTGEIPIREDDGLDCFEDYSTIEGMKAVSNYQIRKEGR